MINSCIGLISTKLGITGCNAIKNKHYLELDSLKDLNFIINLIKNEYPKGKFFKEIIRNGNSLIKNSFTIEKAIVLNKYNFNKIIKIK